MIDLTPLEVRKKKGDFRRIMRGYDPATVDDFLDIAADRLEELVRENMGLVERLSELEEQVSQYREREKALTDALVTAQELREQVRRQSEREAELAKQASVQETSHLRQSVEEEAERLRLAAEQAAAQVREAAKQEVAELLAAAHREAEQLVAKARDEGRRHEATLARLQIMRREFLDNYRELLQRGVEELEQLAAGAAAKYSAGGDDAAAAFAAAVAAGDLMASATLDVPAAESKPAAAVAPAEPAPTVSEPTVPQPVAPEATAPAPSVETPPPRRPEPRTPAPPPSPPATESSTAEPPPWEPIEAGTGDVEPLRLDSFEADSFEAFEPEPFQPDDGEVLPSTGDPLRAVTGANDAGAAFADELGMEREDEELAAEALASLDGIIGSLGLDASPEEAEPPLSVDAGAEMELYDKVAPENPEAGTPGPIGLSGISLLGEGEEVDLTRMDKPRPSPDGIHDGFSHERGVVPVKPPPPADSLAADLPLPADLAGAANEDDEMGRLLRNAAAAGYRLPEEDELLLSDAVEDDDFADDEDGGWLPDLLEEDGK
jgi:cell division initiation protein